MHTHVDEQCTINTDYFQRCSQSTGIGTCLVEVMAATPSRLIHINYSQKESFNCGYMDSL